MSDKLTREFVGITGNHQPINNNLNIVLFLLIKRWGVFNIINFAINTHSAKTFTVQFSYFFAIFTFAAAHNRGQKI